jgi:hypothetical protein
MLVKVYKLLKLPVFFKEIYLIFNQKYSCQAKYPAGYPAFGLAGYPAKTLSGATLVLSTGKENLQYI